MKPKKIVIPIRIKITLWSAIKLRIAGLGKFVDKLENFKPATVIPHGESLH